ncbi:mcm10 [Scenedesmus sp. PABB004]|nr:mcm10 [Scenedesmus sp. PABB004]
MAADGLDALLDAWGEEGDGAAPEQQRPAPAATLELDALFEDDDDDQAAPAAPAGAPPPQPPPAARQQPPAPRARAFPPLTGGGGLAASGVAGAAAHRAAKPGGGGECLHYVEKLTGLKIKLPRVSGVVLRERFRALTWVPLAKAKDYHAPPDGAGWVTVGVLVAKAFGTTSAGAPYSRWRLSDLSGADAWVALFGDAHKDHYAAGEGSVVALHSPRFAPKGPGAGGGGGGGGGGLAVAQPAQVELLAASAGWGFCRGVTKAGTRCTNAVDTTQSQFCSYHALQQAKTLRGGTAQRAARPAGGRRRGGAAGAARAAGPPQPPQPRAVSAGGPGGGPAAAAGGGQRTAAAEADRQRRHGAQQAELRETLRRQLEQQRALGAAGSQARAAGGCGSGAAARGAAGSGAGSGGGSGSSGFCLSAVVAAVAADGRQQHGGEPPPPRQPKQQAPGAGESPADSEEGDDDGGLQILPPGSGQQRREQQPPADSQQQAAAAAARAGIAVAAAVGRPAPSGGVAKQRLKADLGLGPRPSKAAKAKAGAAGRSQQPRAPGLAPGAGGGGSFQAAFGRVLQRADVAKPDARLLDAVAGAAHSSMVAKLLDQYGQKDQLAQQLDGLTKLTVRRRQRRAGWRRSRALPSELRGAAQDIAACARHSVTGLESRRAAPAPPPARRRAQVTAFECRTCRGLSEKRRAACASHDVVPLRVTKRWWTCDACGWRVTTLREVLPSRRCPHCRDPGLAFTAASAYAGPKAPVLGLASAGAAAPASREAMLPRGTEHAFCLQDSL